MSLNPQYVIAPSLQQYFVDKDTGAPLAGGRVYFYSDPDFTQPKSVYTLQGNEANYTYEALANPIVLSNTGTTVDTNGNDITIYYKPYDDEGNLELYYIRVTSSTGVPQFTRMAWPNITSGSAGGASGLYNFIPNGQLLAHTNLENDALVGGSNVIAQGGLSIELSPSPTSSNTIQFLPQQISAINQSPRYVALYSTGTPAGSETIKNIRIKWPNVFKFSSGLNRTFTFAFFSQADVSLLSAIKVAYNFGTNGSPEIVDTLYTPTIATGPTFADNVFTIEFRELIGYLVDSDNNDDFVAIDIALPLNIGFTLRFTDLVLVEGEQDIAEFPLQTNADMLTRGVAGWMDVPNEDGYDLYCPLILTREGMKFDRSQIGKIFADVGETPDPDSVDAVTNEMPCDGSSYVAADYSALGIPYARLRDVLLEKSPISNYPVFGTGSEFATAFGMGNNHIFLMVNKNGTGVAAAAAATSGFTVSGAVTYGGSSTGAASINLLSSWNTSGFLTTRGTNFLTPASALAQGGVGTGFTLATFASSTGQYSYQNKYGFSISTVTAALLEVGSGNARSLRYSNASTSYTLYYRVTGSMYTGLTPADGARTINILTIPNTLSAGEVALLTSAAFNSYQISSIQITAAPTPNVAPGAAKHFTLQTNPGLARTFYVWYKYSAFDEDPADHAVTGTGIRVDLTADDTAATVRTKTILAINSTEFAVPDFRGMFLRGADLTGIFDTDNGYRFGFGLGLGGANYGTYEYDQFRSHAHADTAYQTNNDGTNGPKSVLNTPPSNTLTTDNTGGSETRPVNAYVNWVIKY